MPIYYLLAYPESVVSILNEGKLPADLPTWSKSNCLFFSTKLSPDFFGTLPKLNQIFILSVELTDELTQGEDFLVLETCSPANIQEIFVYSDQARHLLNKRFNDNCPRPIIVRPELFPANTLNPAEKRTSSTFFAASTHTINHAETKKQRTELSSSNSNGSGILFPSQRGHQFDKPIRRIATCNDHLQVLQKGIQGAKKSILITSFSILHDTMQRADLYSLLAKAAQRGVRIYIYYNDQHQLTDQVTKFLRDHNISYAETYTHSKILMVDHTFIVAGSFNWLSGFDKRYTENDEGSIYIRDEKVCQELSEEIWRYIKYYRHQQFGNYRALRRLASDPDHESAPSLRLSNDSELIYLPTLDQHCGFLQDVFLQAQQRIIIVSPFISASGAYEEDINLKLLQHAIARNVKLYFICASDSPSLNNFKQYIAKLRFPQLHVIALPHIHLKTIIVDEKLIAEGSFNWLSASREEESDFHNHEQTLVVEGSMAKPLITEFFQTRVGRTLSTSISELHAAQNNSSSSNTNTRPRLAM